MGATSRDVESQIKLIKEDLKKYDKNMNLDWELNKKNTFFVTFILNDENLGRPISISGTPSNRR